MSGIKVRGFAQNVGPIKLNQGVACVGTVLKKAIYKVKIITIIK